MISVQLRDEIVIIIPVSIIEVSQVAFLAPFATRPCVVMITRHALASGNQDSMIRAPLQGFRRRIFIGQPGVELFIFSQVAAERASRIRFASELSFWVCDLFFRIPSKLSTERTETLDRGFWRGPTEQLGEKTRQNWMQS
jgi:hypothetical protein